MSIKWASSTTIVSITSVWTIACDISSNPPKHINYRQSLTFDTIHPENLYENRNVWKLSNRLNVL